MAEKQPEKPSQVDIYYERTHSYRLYHVDGAHGGITPRGNLTFDLYVDRPEIPKMIRREVSEHGKLGDEISRGGRKGILRQIECGVVLDFQAAANLHDWLGEMLDRAQQHGIFEKAEEENGEDS